jgi:hypothetical protein
MVGRPHRLAEETIEDSLEPCGEEQFQTILGVGQTGILDDAPEARVITAAQY